MLRRPIELAQYAAQAYRALLSEHSLIGSMGRRGNPYDNAMMESFMKTLKVEGVYPTREQQHADRSLLRVLSCNSASANVIAELGTCNI